MDIVQIRFLLGPAGSGKTHRCLAEARLALESAPEGPTLLFLAPKQATYQLERRLLDGAALTGYTRLQVLSFERLARLVFSELGKGLPGMLDEEGRVMVLRALLARKRSQLKIFRASARLTGFARQLSITLSELQRDQLTPQRLKEIAAALPPNDPLACKLHDLGGLLEDYLCWLKEHHLLDADCLSPTAAEALVTARAGTTAPRGNGQPPVPTFADVWVDGFGEWPACELNLLAELAALCGRVTITFCLEDVPPEKSSWLSPWSVVADSFHRCRAALSKIPGSMVSMEVLRRNPERTRFQHCPTLARLEQEWGSGRMGPSPAMSGKTIPMDSGNGAVASPANAGVRIVHCATPEDEARVAAREILRHTRAGGRFRETTVLVRNLKAYHADIQRVFSAFEIPFFLDRREAVAHHPLAELTRSALRIAALDWRHEDVFAALKTGLLEAKEGEIDRLENEALARGWRASAWKSPPIIPDDRETEVWVNEVHRRLLPPLKKLAAFLQGERRRVNGPEIARVLRELWSEIRVETRLRLWAAQPVAVPESLVPSTLHNTVWQQAQLWLQNVELAFSDEPLSVREWLPILEAGLGTLNVGVIPPALDQVLIGPIDRSRDPDVKLALVLGLNEGVFPSLPQAAALLSDADRATLEDRHIRLGSTLRRHMARERHLGYLACTRPRERLVLTYAAANADGDALNPSPFLSDIQRVLPELCPEKQFEPLKWQDAEHPSELLLPLLNLERAGIHDVSSCAATPFLSRVLARLHQYGPGDADVPLSPGAVTALYGTVLRTSVSRLEQFGACPFRFFINSGLRADERKRFELDRREQGSFQHEVLAAFHQQLCDEGKRWRDLTPEEAKRRIGALSQAFAQTYGAGLLQDTEQTRFLARAMGQALQEFVATLIAWMREQYLFDPAHVELSFGRDSDCPAWVLGLGAGRQLELHGRIDRIDLYRRPGDDEALCVVVDYKSAEKKLEDLLINNGLQLQLLAYLNVVRHLPELKQKFGAHRVVPAGVFYVNLNGKYKADPNRGKALENTKQARKLAYQHCGRFDARVLPLLDSRPNVAAGDQFKFTLKKDGTLNKSCKEALPSGAFMELLDSIEATLRHMGQEIFSGRVAIAPYRRGKNTACDHCEYRSICRIDPWTHPFRVLRKAGAQESDDTEPGVAG